MAFLSARERVQAERRAREGTDTIAERLESLVSVIEEELDAMVGSENLPVMAALGSICDRYRRLHSPPEESKGGFP